MSVLRRGYRNSVGNNGENFSIFSLIWLQGHAGSKTLHQQNSPVLNWRHWLMPADLYNGYKKVADWWFQHSANSSFYSPWGRKKEPIFFCVHLFLILDRNWWCFHIHYWKHKLQFHILIFAHINTHTHPFNGPFPGLPRWAGTRKVKPIWLLLKQETVSGSGISWAICKYAPRSRQITMPAPHHSVFYRRMPFLQPNQQCHRTEGTKARINNFA